MILRETDKTLSVTKEALEEFGAEVKRISVAVYDEKIDTVRVYAHAGFANEQLNVYEANLSEHFTLSRIKESGEIHVVEDFLNLKDNRIVTDLKKAGVTSSFTLPLYSDGHFLGFSFIDFGDVKQLPGRKLIGAFKTFLEGSLHGDLQARKYLKRTVDAVKSVSNYRDNETGMHLDRMSRYARILAQKMSARYGLSNEFVENVYNFSPLHDVGKIAISDDILFKPGRLTENEFQEMQKHTVYGEQIVNDICDRLHLGDREDVKMLQNVVRSHHETIDGKGYPEGLAGDSIPLEARITTVADVFDALSNERPYKEAWSVGKTVSFLKENAGDKFDAEIVNILEDSLTDVLRIKDSFKEPDAA